ncbi:hypothetical protein DV515_00019277 [Chloebia gouldiae]|uniref:Uncharacterized protein n=1 Tax=Chloebia gouldiae TaxID=44316 RepID=A0A3L8Q5J3_CHLGU|nr:hypothetical protein DV515_00019277 [Chloebia gouldiae]
MLVNFAFKSFPGRAAAECGASVLASPLHALEESLCKPPGRAGAPMGVVRAPSCGAGGSTVWSGAERRQSVAFRLPQQRGPGGGRAGCPRAPAAGSHWAPQHQDVPALRPGPGLARLLLCRRPRAFPCAAA